MTGFIYKITIEDESSSLNKKYYIGRCISRSPEKYWGSGKIIKDYIKQKGTSNLTKEILEDNISKEFLNEKEKFYISDLWKKDLNCLNLKPGGEMSPNPIGKKCYNNGFKNILLSVNESVPNGFNLGKIKNISPEISKKYSNNATVYTYTYRKNKYKTKELFIKLVSDGLIKTKNINMSTGSMGRIIRSNSSRIGISFDNNINLKRGNTLVWTNKKRNVRSRYNFIVDDKVFLNSRDLFDYLNLSNDNWNRLRWVRTNRKDVKIIDIKNKESIGAHYANRSQ